MSETQADLLRSMAAVTEDAAELHRIVLAHNGKGFAGHSALGDVEEADDIGCLTCGHINEAEYEWAVAATKLVEPPHSTSRNSPSRKSIIPGSLEHLQMLIDQGIDWGVIGLSQGDYIVLKRATIERNTRKAVLDEIERRITAEFEVAIGSTETNAGRRILRVIEEMRKENP